jgi:DNA-binding GntR family transcriptional regulator
MVFHVAMRHQMQTAIQSAMQHVEHVSLATQVLRQIRSAIVLGDLAPGARLTFRDVAQRLNASVTPVREALLQLVAERVLSVGPGRTITVPILTRAQFLELRVVRIALEGLAAEAAARQAGEVLADELQAIHHRLDDAKRARDARQATIQNRLFHFRLYEAAALPALLGMIENIWLRTGPYHRYIFADAAGTSSIRRQRRAARRSTSTATSSVPCARGGRPRSGARSKRTSCPATPSSFRNCRWMRRNGSNVWSEACRTSGLFPRRSCSRRRTRRRLPLCTWKDASGVRAMPVDRRAKPRVDRL